MKLSTKTRYGTRAMLELALRYPDGEISAREIAASQSVSPKYLEHLLASLRSAGLIRSVRGAQGGHSLTRPPDQINLREIYRVFEGSEGFVECTTSPELCARADDCATREVWAEMYAACMAVLEATSLEDLVRLAQENQRQG
jgi:Rrf2 family cysteine metabolism transcriptional repressor